MAGGLDGVVAAETILSHTDPTNGMVWVRGHDLPSLVAQYGFEGTVALLWNGFAGERLTRAGIADALGRARSAAYETLPAWLPQAAGRSLFEGVRIAIAAQPDNADACDSGWGFDGCGPGAGAAGVRAADGCSRSGDFDRRRPVAHVAWHVARRRPRRRRWIRISRSWPKAA